MTTSTEAGAGALVICATCGKNNADHLVFCEDCGARLAPRIAPPTPPIGVPRRPSTAGPPRTTKCGRCGAPNAPGMRFCITCGSALQKASVPVPAQPPRRRFPRRRRRLRPSPIPAAPAIAPAPVVGVGAHRADGDAHLQALPGHLGQERPVLPLLRRVPQRGRAVAPDDALGAPRTATHEPVARRGSTRRCVDVRRPSSRRSDRAAELARPSTSRGRLVVDPEGRRRRPELPARRPDRHRPRRGRVHLRRRPLHRAAPRAPHAQETARSSIRDLGTPNGVYLRVRKGEAGAPLEDQDLILLGQQVLRFEVVKDAEAGFGAASEHGTLVFGTPAAPRYARLSQRTTEGVSCDVFHVRKPETVLGRESGDVVFPDDPFLSRRHAAIALCREGPRTHVHARRPRLVERHVRAAFAGKSRLAHGDQFRIGQQLFRVDLGGT